MPLIQALERRPFTTDAVRVRYSDVRFACRHYAGAVTPMVTIFRRNTRHANDIRQVATMPISRGSAALLFAPD